MLEHVVTSEHTLGVQQTGDAVCPPLPAGQPETRRYRARFVDNGVPVGDWSDIITVTAQA